MPLTDLQRNLVAPDLSTLYLKPKNNDHQTTAIITVSNYSCNNYKTSFHSKVRDLILGLKVNNNNNDVDTLGLCQVFIITSHGEYRSRPPKASVSEK